MEDVIDFIEYADKDGDNMLNYKDYMDVLSKNSEKELFEEEESSMVEQGDKDTISEFPKCEPFGEGK